MNSTSRRRGYTLLELAVSISMLGIIAGGAVVASARGLATVRTANARGEINTRAGRTMSRLLYEVEALGASSLDPALITATGMPIEFSAGIEFRSGTGWQAGGIVWGNMTRLEFVTDSNELENGLDDDGDGLIDEGSIVLTRDVGTPSETRVAIANGVRGYLAGELPNGLDDNGNGMIDERGLCFTREDRVLTIEFTLESDGPDGDPLARTLRNSIRIRN